MATWDTLRWVKCLKNVRNPFFCFKNSDMILIEKSSLREEDLAIKDTFFIINFKVNDLNVLKSRY